MSRNAVTPPSRAALSPDACRSASVPFEIPVFLLQGVKANRPEPAGKPERRGCSNPCLRVAPSFSGWTRYGYWTESGRLIGAKDR